jgi:hypothetical protein
MTINADEVDAPACSHQSPAAHSGDSGPTHSGDGLQVLCPLTQVTASKDVLPSHSGHGLPPSHSCDGLLPSHSGDGLLPSHSGDGLMPSHSGDGSASGRRPETPDVILAKKGGGRSSKSGANQRGIPVALDRQFTAVEDRLGAKNGQFQSERVTQHDPASQREADALFNLPANISDIDNACIAQDIRMIDQAHAGNGGRTPVRDGQGNEAFPVVSEQTLTRGEEGERQRLLGLNPNGKIFVSVTPPIRPSLLSPESTALWKPEDHFKIDHDNMADDEADKLLILNEYNDSITATYDRIGADTGTFNMDDSNRSFKLSNVHLMRGKYRDP